MAGGRRLLLCFPFPPKHDLNKLQKPANDQNLQCACPILREEGSAWVHTFGFPEAVGT